MVLETTGESTFIGRYHEETPAGVLLHDAAEHRDHPGGASRSDFVARSRKFGVRADRPHVVVPLGQIRRIVRLMDWGEDVAGT